MRGARPSNNERRIDRKRARKAAERALRIAKAGQRGNSGAPKKVKKA